MPTNPTHKDEVSAPLRITHNPVYQTTYEGADPTRGFVYVREDAQPQPAGLVEKIKREIIQEICELPGDNDPDADNTLILSLTDLEVILDRTLNKDTGDVQ